MRASFSIDALMSNIAEMYYVWVAMSIHVPSCTYDQTGRFILIPEYVFNVILLDLDHVPILTYKPFYNLPVDTKLVRNKLLCRPATQNMGRDQIGDQSLPGITGWIQPMRNLKQTLPDLSIHDIAMDSLQNMKTNLVPDQPLCQIDDPNHLYAPVVWRHIGGMLDPFTRHFLVFLDDFLQ